MPGVVHSRVRNILREERGVALNPHKRDDALKARDGVVLRMDDDHLPDDKRPRANEKQGESFAGPLFYEWRLEN
jgi:hypothetical protein